MSLDKFAIELEETARQSAELADGVIDAVNILSDKKLDCADARDQAIQRIILALQGQDRIEQRCQNMANAIRTIESIDNKLVSARDNIWSHLTLDELAVPEYSGIAKKQEHGDVDLF